MPEYVPGLLTREFGWVWRYVPNAVFGPRAVHLSTLTAPKATTACGIRIREPELTRPPTAGTPLSYCPECRRRNGGEVA